MKPSRMTERLRMGVAQRRRAGRIAAWITFAAVSVAGASASAGTHWTLVDVGTLGGPGSYGTAISDSGLVVGCSDVMPGGVHAFIYRDGVMQDLGTGVASAAGN